MKAAFHLSTVTAGGSPGKGQGVDSMVGQDALLSLPVNALQTEHSLRHQSTFCGCCHCCIPVSTSGLL